MIDNIIKWSGWIIAVCLVGWELAKYMRNRYKVNINVYLEHIHKGEEERTVVIEASNLGRRPINLTFAGLFFEKDTILSSDEMNIEIGWVYKKLPSYSFVKLGVLKELVRSLKKDYGVEANGICFLDESGDKHIGYFSKNLRKLLYS